MLQLWCIIVSVSCAFGSAFPCPGSTTADQVLAADSVDLTGKMAIVTGGDKGIGYVMSVALARRGGTVVIGNRNQSSGTAAAQQIAKEAGVSLSRVLAMQLDLSSLDSVRAFAEAYQERFGLQLHFLLNNAGITSPSVKSKDGFELVFEIDYLGHFLLTELLLPALRRSSPSRIVNTASGSHKTACKDAGLPADCFKDFSYLPPPLVNATAKQSSYGIGKLLLIEHAAALAVREKENGIVAFSVTPGFTNTSMTSGGRGMDPKELKSICDNQIHPGPGMPVQSCPFSPSEGAASIAHALLVTGERSGAYFSRVLACEEEPVVMNGFTPAMQLELYERSLSWCFPQREVRRSRFAFGAVIVVVSIAAIVVAGVLLLGRLRRRVDGAWPQARDAQQQLTGGDA